MANPALCLLLGYQEPEFIQKEWIEVIKSKQIEHLSNLYAIQTGDRQNYRLNSLVQHKNGSLLELIVAVAGIHNPDKELQFFLFQFVNTKNKVILPELKTEIEEAIAARQFVLHYQAIKDLATLQTVGYEGLIRWNHPTKGLLSPPQFIEDCESDADLQSQICNYVFMEGLTILPKLNGWLSLNISPQSLLSNSFLETITEFAKVSDLPNIYFEITERTPLDFASLRTLELLGYGVFVDDFGQGHSGLIQVIEILKKISSDRFMIKFDIWFSRNIKDKDVYNLLYESLRIIHSYKLQAIAEGIETEEQLDLWRSLGCNFGQGWLWGKAKKID